MSALSSGKKLLQLVLFKKPAVVVDFLQDASAWDSAKVLIAQLLPLHRNHADQAGILDGRATQTLSEASQTEVALQRQAALKKDSRLADSYDELVRGGVLSREEFWETHRRMLVSETSAARLRPGIEPAVHLAPVAPLAETPSALHFRLTPSLIHQIFVEHPAVQKAYQEYVPHKLTEYEFWKKYLKSTYITNKAGPKPPEEIFNLGTENPEAMRASKKQKTDPTPAPERPKNKAQQLMSDFNRHSDLLLAGKADAPATVGQEAAYRAAIGWTELEEDQSPEYVPLHIQGLPAPAPSPEASRSQLRAALLEWLPSAERVSTFLPKVFDAPPNETQPAGPTGPLRAPAAAVEKAHLVLTSNCRMQPSF